MGHILSDSSIVVAAKDQVSCPLGDDIVILDLRAGLYFSLDNVGAMIWQLIQQPRTVQDVRIAVLDTFDVAQEKCQQDILSLLQELAGRSLIEIRDAAPV